MSHLLYMQLNIPAYNVHFTTLWIFVFTFFVFMYISFYFALWYKSICVNARVSSSNSKMNMQKRRRKELRALNYLGLKVVRKFSYLFGWYLIFNFFSHLDKQVCRSVCFLAFSFSFLLKFVISPIFFFFPP